MGALTSDGNAVAGNVIVGGGIAIADSSRVRVRNNTVSGGFVGISLHRATLDAFEGNVTSRNQFGVTALEVVGAMRRNLANDNASTGFDIARSDLVQGFERNIANGNGERGILASDTHGRYVDNKANRNGDVGLLLTDSLPGHGQFFTVAGNTANANGALGIAVPVATVDGGGNRAHANGDARQCVEIACR